MSEAKEEVRRTEQKFENITLEQHMYSWNLMDVWTFDLDFEQITYHLNVEHWEH